ncbi:MAG TPA: AlkA N-terminal domain-containing protein [Steroidobacteraceae bacterium]|nr:AlkA N-terminal domain-containing protein [Steroidobacteraceae bacterium]
MQNLLGLDRRALERARLSRDPRFDGKFFIAVTSTGIYCRPVCPSPTSKSANVRYYATAAAAAEAGFRPCLRCRPEAAPGTPAWMGTSAVVRRALRLIDAGALDADSVGALAARVGVGARHLARLFLQHVGASPITVAQTRRLQFAKRLLDETDLPVTQIALAAGFSSIRRFNAAFQSTYARSPRELRKRPGGLAAGVAPGSPGNLASSSTISSRSSPQAEFRGPREISRPRRRRSLSSRDRRDFVGWSHGVDPAGEVALRLAYRPPYDWAQVRDFLAVRALPGVERVDERAYLRTVALISGPAIVSVRPLEDADALELRVRGAPPAALFQLSSAARRTFDLAADPARIAQALKSDALLAPLIRIQPGLRIPGAWDPFECAVRAVLGQQVSVAAGRTFAARVVQRAGSRINSGIDGLTHVFPTPAQLMAADLEGLGITGTRIRALQQMARAILEERLDFRASAEEVGAVLASLPGLGDWTAQYVALRALGEPDAFLTGDLILRRAAADGGAPLSVRALSRRAESWRPWRGYAVLHLWSGDHRRRVRDA